MSGQEPSESALWRARTCEAAGRTAELAAERAVLEEAREGLRADERERARRLAEQQSRTAELEDRLRAIERRRAALQLEIEAAQEQIDSLVRECAIEGRFGGASRGEARLLERQLGDHQDELRAAETALESARKGLARMQSKLGSGARRVGSVRQGES